MSRKNLLETVIFGESPNFKLGDRINLLKDVSGTNETSGYITFFGDGRISLAQKHPLNSLLYMMGLVPTNYIGEKTYNLKDFDAYEILNLAN